MAASDIGEASVLVASKRVIYVGGLGEGVSQAILRSAMIPFGTIKSLDIPMDYKAGKTRGFAFVEFDDPEDGMCILFVCFCVWVFCLFVICFRTSIVLIVVCP